MKKIISFSAALVIMLSGLSAVSCGKRTKENNDIKTNNTSDGVSEEKLPGYASPGPKVDVSSITGYYTMETVKMPDDAEYIYSVSNAENDEFQILYMPKNSRTKRIYLSDRDLSSFSFIERELPEEAISADYYEIIASDTDKYSDASVIYLIEDHGGLKMPEENDRDFDYEAYYNNCAASFLLVNYADNKVVSSFPIEFPDSDADPNGTFSIFEFDDYLMILRDSSIIFRINKADGSVSEITRLKADENCEDLWLAPFHFIKDRDGDLYVLRTNTEDCDLENQERPGRPSGIKYELCKLEGDSLSEPFITFHDDYCNPQTGYGKYKFIYLNDTALYGICDDGSQEEIINWYNSDLEPMSVFPVGNDEFIGIKAPPPEREATSELVKLKPGDISALAEKTELTIGVLVAPNDSPVETLRKEFNAANDRYHLKNVVYGDPNELVRGDESSGYADNSHEVFTKAYSQLCEDIQNGNGPDIVMGLYYGDFYRLAKNGALADMDQFLDGRSGYTRDDVFPAITKAMSAKDGKIYGLPASFTCDCLFVKNKFWDKPTWTMDEMLKFYDNAPDSAVNMYNYIVRSSMFEALKDSAYDVIDYDKGECHFDSDDFIKRLEFSKRFLPYYEDGLGEIYDYPEFSQEYRNDMFKWFGADKTLVINGAADTWINIIKDIQGNGEEINLVGYPTDNSERGGMIRPMNCYYITSSCQDKDGAWEFVAKALGNNQGIYSCFKPETRNIINKEVGVEHTASGIPVPSLTTEQADMLYDYLCKCSNAAVEYDDDMTTAIYEEANKYFTDLCSAKDAANAIQSRVSEIMKKYR